MYFCGMYSIGLDIMAIIDQLNGVYSEVEQCPRIGNYD